MMESRTISIIKRKECCKLKSKKEIILMTLNYSGVLTSPYEYFEKEDEDERRIS